MIEYDIRLPDGRSFSCSVNKNRNPKKSHIYGASWADLKTFQCPNCPLDEQTSPACPLAIDLQEASSVFKTLPNNVQVDVVVKSQDRWYFKNISAQKAFDSFFRYLIETSSCPLLRGNQWQRNFHIPFLDDRQEAFFEVAHQSVNLFGMSHENRIKVEIDLFSEKNKQQNVTKASFLKRCQNAAKQDEAIKSLLDHLEYSLGRTIEMTALVGEIFELNYKNA